MNKQLLLSHLVLALSALVAFGEEPETIPQMIARLGSENYAERLQATTTLEKMGLTALEDLRQAAKADDIEIRNRALALLRKLEKRLDANRVLEAKKVRLLFKDVPLSEVLEEFSKKTGSKVQLHPKSGPADRKVSLDTGEVSFWEAFDQLCKAAQLVEAEPPPDPSATGYRVTTIISNTGNGTTPTDIMTPDQPDKEEVLFLIDGEPANRPTLKTGALRLVALPPGVTSSGQSAQGEVLVTLDVSLEPRLKWLQVQSVRVAEASTIRSKFCPASSASWVSR